MLIRVLILYGIFFTKFVQKAFEFDNINKSFFPICFSGHQISVSGHQNLINADFTGPTGPPAKKVNFEG